MKTSPKIPIKKHHKIILNISTNIHYAYTQNISKQKKDYLINKL